MSDARIGDSRKRVPLQEAVYPSLRRLPVSSALWLSCIALFASLLALQYASACSARSVAYDVLVLLTGILAGGIAFSWVSLDVLLTELMPAGWGAPVTLSILIWVVMMAFTIRVNSVVLRTTRFGLVHAIRMVAAGSLVGWYATSSALGFCLVARTWSA